MASSCIGIFLFISKNLPTSSEISVSFPSMKYVSMGVLSLWVSVLMRPSEETPEYASEKAVGNYKFRYFAQGLNELFKPFH